MSFLDEVKSAAQKKTSIEIQAVDDLKKKTISALAEHIVGLVKNFILQDAQKSENHLITGYSYVFLDPVCFGDKVYPSFSVEGGSFEKNSTHLIGKYNCEKLPYDNLSELEAKGYKYVSSGWDSYVEFFIYLCVEHKVVSRGFFKTQYQPTVCEEMQEVIRRTIEQGKKEGISLTPGTLCNLPESEGETFLKLGCNYSTKSKYITSSNIVFKYEFSY